MLGPWQLPGLCPQPRPSARVRGRSQKPVALLRNQLLGACWLCTAILREEARVAGSGVEYPRSGREAVGDLGASLAGESQDLFELELPSQ